MILQYCDNCSNSNCDNDKAKAELCLQSRIDELKGFNDWHRKEIEEAKGILNLLSGIKTEIAKTTRWYVESKISDLEDDISVNESMIRDLPSYYED